MTDLHVFNTLTRKKEVFTPMNSEEVGMYSCGPTVYNYAHVGNLRTYLFNDILRRSLVYLGYHVKHVMNVTDVDDKTIKASRSSGEDLRTFTSRYEELFLTDLDSLGIIRPHVLPRATDHVHEIITLIRKLIDSGAAYVAKDGVYFSIAATEGYGALAQLSKIKKTKARVASDSYDKEQAQDFALWKFWSEADGEVVWDAPFGRGRPGWHIECSAMSMHCLGESFDIHTGAVDLIFPHHTNEIAQSEAATGKQFVKYWMHGGFLTFSESKMSKSLGNVVLLKDLVAAGFSPIDFRYLCLLTHYRKNLVFSLTHLRAARSARERMMRKVGELRGHNVFGDEGTDRSELYIESFRDALNDDLNMPAALQVFLKVVDDMEFDPVLKLSLLERFDSVLGLRVHEAAFEVDEKIPEGIVKLVSEREHLRKKRDWDGADRVRKDIEAKGYLVEDSPTGSRARKLV